MASTSSIAGDTTKDLWVPTFSNRPQDYREWRARIHLYYKKMQLQKKPVEGIINILTTMTGTAWKQLEPQADALSEDKEGFSKLIAVWTGRSNTMTVLSNQGPSRSFSIASQEGQTKH